MGAGFHHHAFLQHYDPVGVGDGGQAVGNGDHGSALARTFKGFLDVMFGLAVECAGCFVQQQDWRVLQQRACDPDALLFSAGQLQATFTNTGVILFGQGHDEVVDLGIPRSLDDLVMRGKFAPIGDVVIDRIIEQHRVLGDHADGLMQAVLGDITDILAINGNRAAGDVIEAEQQAADCRFAGPRGADNGNGLAGWYIHTDLIQNLPLRII